MHSIQQELRNKARPEKIKVYLNFMKTGKGEYAEGEQLIGVTIPDIRTIAQGHIHVKREELIPILQSPIHEDRMCALMVLSYQYPHAQTEREQKAIVDFFITHHYAANNWDLIDCIVDRILGPWLYNKPKDLLYQYARSSNLWERRIAIITTYYFIKQKHYLDTLAIAEILLNDKHDLIHKAVGWMLREVGKRDEPTLKAFLAKHYKAMPRTMLRYAIERFPEQTRKQYLKGIVK
jgi:3-methyladenine DNA glycosylase AlkD